MKASLRALQMASCMIAFTTVAVPSVAQTPDTPAPAVSGLPNVNSVPAPSSSQDAGIENHTVGNSPANVETQRAQATGNGAVANDANPSIDNSGVNGLNNNAESQVNGGLGTNAAPK